MMNKIILGGAPANCSGDFSSEDLLVFLMAHTENVDYYKLNPPPGSIMNAAFDWQAILGVTASTLAIGQALWAAYNKFIKPLHDKEQSSSFLFVTVRNEKKEFVQFSIGKEYMEEESFIQEFSEKVEKIRISKVDETIEIEKTEIEVSEIWKKI